jgi:uncharacterized membrane protein
MHNADNIATLLGGFIGSWLVIGVVVFVALSFFTPLMLWSIMRSAKGIRRELSTLNETLQNKLTIR